MALSARSLPSPPSTVLVTGASGFIGSWVCRTLLEAGYHVRGTVRDAAKGEYLKTLFSDFSVGFDYAIVLDITKVRWFLYTILDGFISRTASRISRSVEGGIIRCRAHRESLWRNTKQLYRD